MLSIKQTPQFKKDLKAAIKQGCDLDLLAHIIDTLARREPLPAHHRDHALSGRYRHHRECHITPDWLLIYQIREDTLILSLTRLGIHAKLFRL